MDGCRLEAKGPKGELTLDLDADIQAQVSGGSLSLKSKSGRRDTLGLYRALCQNVINGVSQGYHKDLEMVGVGFKAKKDGRNLILNIGFSHTVTFVPPQGCEVQVSDDIKITVSGSRKDLVGQTAARIRELKPPEPYKGKGIKYSNEVVRRKSGKASKVGSAVK